MTKKEIINEIKCLLSELNNGEDAVSYLTQNDVKWLNENIKALEQEPKIKVLDRDEVISKLGAVDVYQASAWITLLNDLEYLGLKICEVKE
jgi:hypothetical protein